MNLTKGARRGVLMSTSKAWWSSPTAADGGGMEEMARQRQAEVVVPGASTTRQMRCGEAEPNHGMDAGNEG
jgi:hypothetical protein